MFDIYILYIYELLIGIEIDFLIRFISCYLKRSTYVEMEVIHQSSNLYIFLVWFFFYFFNVCIFFYVAEFVYLYWLLGLCNLLHVEVT